MVEDNLGRFAHFALDPFWWDTYRVMQERGLLDDVKTKDWDSGAKLKATQSVHRIMQTTDYLPRSCRSHQFRTLRHITSEYTRRTSYRATTFLYSWANVAVQVRPLQFVLSHTRGVQERKIFRIKRRTLLFRWLVND
jgi:hypothetical protein